MRLTKEQWEQAKDDYLNLGLTYRDISAKYETSLVSVSKKAKRDGWQTLKKGYDKECAQIIETAKEVSAVSVIEKAKESVITIYEIADSLAEKIAGMIETEDLRPSDIRALTSALKDIKELKGIKSEADMREQEARIAKLLHDTENNVVDDNSYGVVLMPEVREV